MRLSRGLAGYAQVVTTVALGSVYAVRAAAERSQLDAKTQTARC